MEDTNLREEVERLREECNHLREERNSYRKELEEQSIKAESLLSAQLKLLAVSLSKEIRGEMLESVKRWIWIFAIAMGIATIGGFLSLQDIIKGRIDTKLQEKENEVQKLRENIIQGVADFKVTATEAINDLSLHKKNLTEETNKLHRDMTQAVNDLKDQITMTITEIDKSKEEVKKVTLLSISEMRHQVPDIQLKGQ